MNRQHEKLHTQFEDLAPYYDELMRSVPYVQWVEYVRLLWSLHEFAPRRVLDAACGTGNVTLELARLGYEMTGVDLSHPMIAQAQRKIQVNPPHVWVAMPRFVTGDLRDLRLNEVFDGATCLYDSLNYILEPDDLRLAFTSVRSHVRKGGLWVFDMNSDWAFRANLFTQNNRDPRHALHYFWQADFDAASHICQVEMHFERRNPDGDTSVFYETHRERAYQLDEIVAMLGQSGWHFLHAYDAYTLNRPHARSERWYFVARNDE